MITSLIACVAWWCFQCAYQGTSVQAMTSHANDEAFWEPPRGSNGLASLCELFCGKSPGRTVPYNAKPKPKFLRSIETSCSGWYFRFHMSYGFILTMSNLNTWTKRCSSLWLLISKRRLRHNPKVRRLTSLESQCCTLHPSRFLSFSFHFLSLQSLYGTHGIPWSHANELPSIIGICTFTQPSMPPLRFGAPQGWPSARPEEDIGGQKGNVPPEVSPLQMGKKHLVGGWKDSEWAQICNKDWNFAQVKIVKITRSFIKIEAAKAGQRNFMHVSSCRKDLMVMYSVSTRTSDSCNFLAACTRPVYFGMLPW